jgi:hypothetical protein
VELCGKVLLPNETRRHQADSGQGSTLLNELDTFIILPLNIPEPSQGLPTYATWMYYFNGTLVGASVICWFFKKAFLLGSSLQLQRNVTNH